MNTTTHLVCAPEHLPPGATVQHWLIRPGQYVEADIPLLLLQGPHADCPVLAPLAGVLTEHCVQAGEAVSACALVAMIEAEEQAFGLDGPTPLPLADDLLSVAACKQAGLNLPPTAGTHAPAAADTPPPPADALLLCAALGLAPEEIAGAGPVTLAAVHRHVRRELRLLATLRHLLGQAPAGIPER